MNRYKIKVEIKSPLVTPIKADTLFGHICWGIRYHRGEKALEDFLAMYSDEPPLVFSDAFPEGFLPKPLLAPSSIDFGVKEYEYFKEFKKLKYVPAAWFTEDKIIFTETFIMNKLFRGEIDMPKMEKAYEHMHNTISRISGSVIAEQSPYPVNEYWFDKNSILDIYAVSSFSDSEIMEMVKRAVENGYGADRSTGKGWIVVKSVKKIDNFPTNGNRAMALSSFVPVKAHPENLRAEIFTRFGKLGDYFTNMYNPFKKPLIMYACGATMDVPDNKEYFGGMVYNIHRLPKIVHSAYAPLILFEEEGEK